MDTTRTQAAQAEAAVAGAALTGTEPTGTAEPTGRPATAGPLTAQDTSADAGGTDRNGTGGGASPHFTAQADASSPAQPGAGAPVVPPVQGVGATAPAAPAAPAAAPAPATPVPGPPATQIAMRIAPLRLDADGVHRLTINLHPVDLGPVQVIAEIRNGSINVQLAGSTDAGADALRNAMDDLRRELEQSGFANTTLDLRQGPGQQDQARQQFAFPGRGPGGGGGPAAESRPPAEPAPAARPAADDGRLDIQA